MGASHPKSVVDCPRVVIVGGGWGGAEVAQLLDYTDLFNVLLIDRKDHFFNNIAAVRTTVEDGFATKLMVPYHKLMKNGAFLQAEVEEIRADSIVVRGHASPISFDYLVIALGSAAPFPCKPPTPERLSSLSHYTELLSAMKAAKTITVVGGGPTGVEVTAEIATDFPEKKVRLIHAGSDILATNLKAELKHNVSSVLKTMNVDIVLNERILVNEEVKHQVQRGVLIQAKDGAALTLRSEKGTEYNQDLALFCTGVSVSNSLLATHFSTKLNSEGRLKVNEFLQVEGLGNVFALGDIAGSWPKLAYLARQQGGIVAENIQRIQSGKPMKEWKAYDKPASFLALGRNSGAAQFGDSVYGPFMVTMLKSKTLGVERAWKMMKVNEEDVKKMAEQLQRNNLNVKEDAEVKVKNAQIFLQVDGSAAEAILKDGLINSSSHA